MRLRLLVTALVALSGACSSDSTHATQVLLKIRAEGVALSAEAVRVRVLGGHAGALVEQRVVDIEVNDGWPLEIALEPLDGDASRSWRVDAWALEPPTRDLGAGSASGVFDAGKLIRHEIVLRPDTNLGEVPMLSSDEGGATARDAETVDGAMLGADGSADAGDDEADASMGSSGAAGIAAGGSGGGTGGEGSPGGSGGSEVTDAAVDSGPNDACASSPDGTPCGPDLPGPWSSCQYASTCAQTGTRTRQRLQLRCAAGACAAQAAAEETDQTGCGRVTESKRCYDGCGCGYCNCEDSVCQLSGGC